MVIPAQAGNHSSTGSDADEWVPVETMHRLVNGWRHAGGEVELELYRGAKHGFMTGKPDAPHAGPAIERMKAFIRKHKPGVSQTPHYLNAGKVETVYTRLRNEVGHVRSNKTLENTTAEIAQHVSDLADLVKIAISLCP